MAISSTDKTALLKNMTDEQDETTLDLYLKVAKELILSRMYPYVETFDETYEVPEKYDFVQVEVAAYLLNKRGAEGEIGHSESGTSRTYGSAYVPPEMLRSVIPLATVPGGDPDADTKA